MRARLGRLPSQPGFPPAKKATPNPNKPTPTTPLPVKGVKRQKAGLEVSSTAGGGGVGSASGFGRQDSLHQGCLGRRRAPASPADPWPPGLFFALLRARVKGVKREKAGFRESRLQHEEEEEDGWLPGAGRPRGAPGGAGAGAPGACGRNGGRGCPPGSPRACRGARRTCTALT